MQLVQRIEERVRLFSGLKICYVSLIGMCISIKKKLEYLRTLRVQGTVHYRNIVRSYCAMNIMHTL